MTFTGDTKLAVKTRLATIRQVGHCNCCELTPGNPPQNDDEVLLVQLNRLVIKLCQKHKHELRNALIESRHR